MNTFDDFLKRKLEEKEFSPSEEQIASFTRMLDEKEDRKRFLWWPWLVGVGVLVLGAFIILGQDKATGKAVDAEVQLTDGQSSPEFAKENATILPQDHVRENELLQPQSNSAAASILPMKEISTPIENDIDSHKNGSPETSDLKSTGTEKQDPFTASISLDSDEEVKADNSDEKLFEMDIRKDGAPQIPETNIPSSPEFQTLPQTFESPNKSQKEAIEFGRLPGMVSAQIPTLDLSSNINFRNIPASEISVTPLVKAVSHHTKVGIDMGWGLASVKNGGTKENGQRIRMGAFAERNLNSGFSAQLGIGFQYEGDALDFSKESTVSTQGFGLRSTVNTLDIKNLYEVYINAGVNWRKGRHTISSLVQLGYVYGAKGDLVRYTESTFEGVTEDRVSNVWLAVEGLNRLPVDLRLEYGFNVSQDLQLRFGLTVPVVSPMKSYAQEVTSKHVIDSRRSSLYPQLGLRFHLFKI